MGYIKDRTFKDVCSVLGQSSAKLKQEIKKISDKKGGKQRILDLGCGDGNSIDSLAIAHSRVECHGVDVQHPYRKNSVKLRFKFQQEDLQTLSYPDNHFDVIYSCSVLPYVEDKVKALLQAYRVLKPGGLAIIQVDANYFGAMAETL